MKQNTWLRAVKTKTKKKETFFPHFDLKWKPWNQVYKKYKTDSRFFHSELIILKKDFSENSCESFCKWEQIIVPPFDTKLK